MNPNAVRKPEQIKRIMECRQSGLSDYQWCMNQNINPGTFYNWVSKLKKKGCTIPESENISAGAAVKQEVVRLNVNDREMPECSLTEHTKQPSPDSASPTTAIEIQCGHFSLRLFNGADTALIQNTLNCIGGLSHAW